MEKELHKNEKKLMYYLTLYKIEGHTKWRTDIKVEEDGFEKQAQLDKLLVTDKKTFKINRITGEMEQL